MSYTHVAAVGILFILAPLSSAAQPSNIVPPNIVLVMADDMGYSDLGCFGGEIRTPHLNSLATGGLRFTNFYSENMCWVSRAAMLTGVYHKTSLKNGTIHPRCTTLAEVLRASGYQTRMSGKWHLDGQKTYPNDRGFGEFYGILGGASSFYAPHSLSRNRKNVEDEANNDPDYYFTHAISDEAVRMVEEADADKPLFLYVAYTAAHWPLHAFEADIKAYEGDYAQGWDELRKSRLARMKELGIIDDALEHSARHPEVPAWKDAEHKLWQQRRMEVYAAQVTAMDRGIGDIVAALKQTKRYDNTLFFFTVDNGGCHVEYGPNRKGSYLPEKTRDGRAMRPGNLPDIMPGPEDTYQSYGYGWANASNTPYRLFKQFDHEGGIRTPMIAHWPTGIEKPGRLVPAVAHLVDILPSVLEVADIDMPKQIQDKPQVDIDGQSFAAAFAGKDISGRETLFFHHARGKAFRQGDWKIVAQGRGRWELYNLAADPLELNDLAQRSPNKLAELTKLWNAESKRHQRQSAN